jgi:peptidoglycan/xylan/chitin deacetylase (PgdA/CDA1 family)
MTTRTTTSPTTVLAYHRISQRPLPAGTWVSPGQLANHLDTLLRAEIPMLTADSFLAGQAPGVLLTLDDGTEDCHIHRAIFAERGLRPVVFVPVGWVGRSNRWEWPIPGRGTRHLSALQMRELVGLGWEIGLHGATHQALAGRDDALLSLEIDEGKDRLEQLTGQAARLFSYPYGLADCRVAARVRAAGFEAAFTLAGRGPASNRWLHPRRPVYCIDTAGALLAKVRDPGGATWRGRFESWKEAGAHGVGRLAVRLAGG